MSSAQLLAHFDRVAEAPDAVPRLRRFILDLAVRGKLVEQDPEEEASSELVDLLHRPLRRINSDLPFGWVGAEVGELLTFQYGKPRPATEGIGAGEIPVFGSNGVVGFCREALSQKPAIIIGRKGSAGALNVCDGPSWTTDVAYFVVPPVFLAIHFLFLALKTLDLDKLGKGVKPGLSRVDAYRRRIPVPPLPEQHRIVAKVDELMALCDRLEAAQAERERRRDRLVEASLRRLNQLAADRQDADFHLRRLSVLTTRREHLEDLRQVILSLAVRGRLGAQDPDDESVVSQLRVNDEKRGAKAKEDRRADEEPQKLLAAEDRWKVPPSWEWRGLADLVLFIDYRGQTPAKVSRGVRLITAKNVRKNVIAVSPEEFLTEATYDTWMTRGFPQLGDVLFTTEAPMGNAAVVRSTEHFALAQRVICFRTYGAVDPQFLVLQLLSEPFQRLLDKTATGLTAKGIKAAKLKRLPVAVPPLAEQHLIVAKVDELMAICDRLEAQLETTRTESRRLLEAVLHKALAVA